MTTNYTPNLPSLPPVPGPQSGPGPHPGHHPDQHANKWRRPMDIRFVGGTIAVLLIALVSVIALGGGINNKDRSIKVTGEASVTSAPDEFIFSPTYSFTNTDRAAALRDIASKSSLITAGLKAIGVTDGQIKSTSSGDSKTQPAAPAVATGTPTSGTTTGQAYSLQFTVTVDDKSLAQKVEDYLTGTTPTAPVSPAVRFSDSFRKQLESKARDEATKDARTKANQSASNLGFKVGPVKTVNDGNGFNGSPVPQPDALDAIAASGTSTADASLPVQPGSQTLRYTVNVEYYVR